MGLGCKPFLFRLLDNHIVFFGGCNHLVTQRDGGLDLPCKWAPVTAPRVATLKRLAGVRPHDVLYLLQRLEGVVVWVTFRHGVDGGVLVCAELCDRQGAEPAVLSQRGAVLIAVQYLLAAVPLGAPL